MKVYGLVGKSLGYSFSKSYFENKFDTLQLSESVYQNFEIQHVSEINNVVAEHPQLVGLNVTWPYKQSIIPFLSDLDETASKIGAVNCIKISDKKMFGYNTDAYGFAQSIKPFLDVNHERALILGTGGASRAVAFALKNIGVQVFYATSSHTKKNADTFLYSDINERMMAAFKLIVNTTPLGTTPQVESCPPLPYEFFGPLHLAYDLVYNPAETLFMKNAKQKGATVINGLSMLKLQAEKSWEIWNAI